MDIRLIIVRGDKGNEDFEQVVFTEEFETKAQDFCPPNTSVAFDKVIDADLPTEFPTEFELRRV